MHIESHSAPDEMAFDFVTSATRCNQHHVTDSTSRLPLQICVSSSLLNSPSYPIPDSFMYEVCRGRVDVADYHETYRNINSACKNVDYGKVQNDNHSSVCDCFH